MQTFSIVAHSLYWQTLVDITGWWHINSALLASGSMVETDADFMFKCNLKSNIQMYSSGTNVINANCDTHETVSFKVGF